MSDKFGVMNGAMQMLNTNTLVDNLLPEFSKLQKQILHIVFFEKSVLRSKIAEQCHTSVATISRVTRQLIEQKLLIESKNGETTGGRRPAFLSINGEYGYVIAVNFACKNVEYAIFDFSGICLFSSHMLIRRNNYLATLYKAIDDAYDIIRERFQKIPLALSIAAHGFLDEKNGIIEKSTSFGWENVHLRDMLVTKYNIKTTISLNTQIAAYGEWIVGGYKQRGIENFATLGIGYGLGCGAVINNTLIKGNGAAGEIGLTPIDRQDPQGRYYSLEQYACGQRMIQLATEQWDSVDNIFLRECNNDNSEDLNDDDIIDGILSNDSFCLRLFDQIIPYIGFSIIEISRMYDPSIIVLTDLYARLGHYLSDRLNAWVRSNLSSFDCQRVHFEISKLKHNASIYGAAYIAFQKMFDDEEP